MAKVALLDYGCGNIRSVTQAFDYLGYAPEIISANASGCLDNISHVVLPGVGAFEKASTGIRERGLDHVIRDHIGKGHYFLGICVGMQVLMDQGHEYGTHAGLGLFSGITCHLSQIVPNAEYPHIGWDRVKFDEGSQFHSLNQDDLFFYFNHSYACQLEDASYASAYADSSLRMWPTLIEKDNIIGIQCHPEKSHVAGLAFLDRFMKLS